MKTMDKGEENAASEEKAHVLMENGRSGTEECLPELEKKEKGSVPALFAYVRVFPEGSVSTLSRLEAEYVIKNIQWTTGNNFTVERGWQQLEEPISALPVEIFFTLESSRLIHRPEQCQFREKWLKDIIENKIILMERLTF